MEKTPTLGPQLVPSLLVSDLERTFVFYEGLGFIRSGAFPDDVPVWGEVTRGGISLQFYTEPPHGTPETPICSGTLYMRTSDVQALADELGGVTPFAWGPEVMDYGMREFAVRDPDGYLIAFTEPVE